MMKNFDIGSMLSLVSTSAIIIFSSFLQLSCGGNSGSSDQLTGEQDESIELESEIIYSYPALTTLDKNRSRIKLSNHINTAANEYLPVLSSDGNTLYFSGMDRTGHFDFKLDFIKSKSAGGEDVFYSVLKDGAWMDARPLTAFNTNSHEVLSQVTSRGDFVVTANYPEKMGPVGKGTGFESTDIFIIRNTAQQFQIQHLPEPINSIFNEADAWLSEDENYILFVSDRPGHQGEYHRKGWDWNGNFWGNTDIYFSEKKDGIWQVPINLGSKINTPFAERSPWLSNDGLSLYLSSNGYVRNKHDLDVYVFTRENKDNWLEWSGPYAISDANTAFDDWGYKETFAGEAYLASVQEKGFKPTQPAVAGDGGFRETNFRSGYEVFGQQIAGLKSERLSNIYVLKKQEDPVFVLTDLFFMFDSAEINPSYKIALDRLVNLISQNSDSMIEIHGHTDNVGTKEYNLNLSQQRADVVKQYLKSQGITSEIEVAGFGDQKPLVDNSNTANRAKNRRVEVFIKR